MENNTLHNLKFGIEVSTRYHQWRRAFLEWWLILVRVISAVGAIVSLIGVSAGTTQKLLGFDVVFLIGLGAVAVAVVNIFDFVFRGDAAAIRHADLYRRLKELQAKMARNPKPSEKQICDWDSEAQLIRADEPPTLWALYMLSWNQAVERQDPINRVGLRKIGFWMRWTKNVFHYLPINFPPVPSPKFPK